MPRPSTLIESKFDVLMCSAANIKSTAGQAQRMTDMEGKRGGGWQGMTKTREAVGKREKRAEGNGKGETC